jgi:hypothetical protein
MRFDYHHFRVHYECDSSIASAGGSLQQVTLCCRIVLAAAGGQPHTVIATYFKSSHRTLNLWDQRAKDLGIGQIWEIAPGRKCKAHYSQARRETIIQDRLQTNRRVIVHWSCRTMAKGQKASKAEMNPLCQMHNIEPRPSRTFKLSPGAKFLEKLTDVFGLYSNPPQEAMVPCLDEKSQIHALVRTQPGLPLKGGSDGLSSSQQPDDGLCGVE